MRDTRKKIWVSPFQSKLFIRFGVYWLIYTITLFNFLFVWRLIREGPGDVGEQFIRCVSDNVPLFLCCLLVGPWMALDAVRFANRLVGPIVRFKATMKKIAGSEPVATIQLRKGDFLVDMQDEFNTMMEALQAKGAVEITPKPLSNSEILHTAIR